MKKNFKLSAMIPIYAIILASLLLLAIGGSHAVTVMVENAPVKNRKCVIIDAGHGGIDGGTTSCTGVLESHINLEIALRLNDLMHLLGIDTILTRDSDRSIHTQGETIAQKKISDLKERIAIINSAQNAILISIHQNYFTESKYYGPQVFYPNTPGSSELATTMQSALVRSLCPESNRVKMPASGVYLMQHINCVGLLIECGFLSNPAEETKLLSGDYQKNICCVIASVCSNYLYKDMIA